MSCWRSNRASQNPSRPASKATQTRRTTRPARRDSSRQRSINLNSCSGSGASFFSGSRASPGARAATSQLDWLISMTTINVLSCSRAVRDLLRSKGLDMERSIVGLTAAMVHYFRRPPHSISPHVLVHLAASVCAPHVFLDHPGGLLGDHDRWDVGVVRAAK